LAGAFATKHEQTENENTSHAFTSSFGANYVGYQKHYKCRVFSYMYLHNCVLN